MNILVFGAGAVGSLLGGFLARAGHHVSFLGRAWHLDAIEKNGLGITGIWDEHRVRNFRLFRSVAKLESAREPFDWIILTVKSFDTKEAVDEIEPILGDRTALISFQNGLGNIETVLEKVRPEQFLIGRTITGVEISPGHVEVTVSAGAMVVGAVPGSILHPGAKSGETRKTIPSFSPIVKPEAVAEIFTSAGIPTRSVPNILMPIWSKVIYNCALNGPCAILEAPYGKMLESEETRSAMRRIVYECYEVAERKKIPLDPPRAAEYFDLLVNRLIPKTASHFPSMLRDLKKGRKTEIDALNGAICRIGRETGVSTPENKRVTDHIRQKENARFYPNKEDT